MWIIKNQTLLPEKEVLVVVFKVCLQSLIDSKSLKKELYCASQMINHFYRQMVLIQLGSGKDRGMRENYNSVYNFHGRTTTNDIRIYKGFPKSAIWRQDSLRGNFMEEVMIEMWRNMEVIWVEEASTWNHWRGTWSSVLCGTWNSPHA